MVDEGLGDRTGRSSGTRWQPGERVYYRIESAKWKQEEQEELSKELPNTRKQSKEHEKRKQKM